MDRPDLIDKTHAIYSLGNKYLFHKLAMDNYPGWNLIFLSDIKSILKRVSRPLIKVAEGQFDRNIEKYVEKKAQEYETRVNADRTRKMEELIEEIDCAHLSIKKVFKVGVPFQELISAIEDEAADMMVMGQKGRSDLAGVLFGSTAEKVFRRCPIPLLSVRPQKQ